MLGIFCTALFLDAISVYIFHDVDKNKIGHWNEAFADLSIEALKLQKALEPPSTHL